MLPRHACMPAGMKATSEPLRVTPVTFGTGNNTGSELLHALLGVSHAKQPQQLLSVNIAGFIYVTDVDPSRGTLTYLAPCAGPLPGKLLLLGSLRVFFQ